MLVLARLGEFCLGCWDRRLRNAIDVRISAVDI